MQWDSPSICEAVAAGLKQCAASDDLEQAVYSIDALDEPALQPLIHQALRDAGHGVWPKQRYPSDRTSQKVKRQSKRCDVVLTPEGMPLVDAQVDDTLFAPPEAVPLEAAYWLEIKTVSMFTIEGPFARYSAELLQTISHDIKNLAGDQLTYHAALLLVLFTSDAAIAEHDLLAWHERCLQKGYAVATPIVRDFSITERMGNTHASVALFPVRRL